MTQERAGAGRRELIGWGLLVAVGLALRLVDLGDRTFHHDESQVAYYSFTYWRDHNYEYLPLLHGPWQYTITAGAYALFGVTDFTARLAPALMGSAMVAMPLLARRQLGAVAALCSGLVIAVSPSLLYYSRFAREDIHIAALTLAAVIVAGRLLERPRPWHPIVLGLLLAGTLTVKESGLFFGALGVAFIVVVVAVPRWRALITGPVRELPAWTWLAGLGAFAALYALLFSSLGSHPAGIWDGIYEGPKYWLDQHGVRRGNEPRTFYVAILAAYEWPVVVAAAIGAVAVIRRPTVWTVFLIAWAGGSLAFYAWAGEKFAWLVIHPLVPLVLLAGIGVQAALADRRRAARAAGAGLAAVGLLYLGWQSFRVNAEEPIDPRELLVTTQSGQDTERVRDEVYALDRRLQAAAGRRVTITVDPFEGGSYPWAWYFRDLPAGYDQAVRNPDFAPSADVLILTEPTRETLVSKLGAYRGRRIAFRVFRLGWHPFSPRRSVDWVLHRRPLGPTGNTPAWVYVRKPER